MDKFDRIYAIHKLLSNARLPVNKTIIEQELECSHATVERIIKEMRLYLGAPILYDRKANGYSYTKDTDTHYELPGLWFNASELYSLLASYQLLSDVEPGLLESHIGPLKEKVEALLKTKSMQKGDLALRVRILSMAARKPNPKHFSIVATALLTRKQVELTYHGREKDKTTQRIVSPQRLIHYRDNWYLDAWCHHRNGLRNFALERIKKSGLLESAAIDIANDELEKHYATAYGIFAGKPNQKAVLKFHRSVAKWVAEERWHPQQKGQFGLDGSYELEIPYRDARELTMDILKYGADVEVLAPEKLRQAIKQKLADAIHQYN